MEHGGRISCCKTLVVAPWQGRRHWRGRGAADPPPFLGQISEPKSYKMGVDFAHQVSRPLGLPDLPMALLGGGGLEKHYCWGCSFSQKKWIPSHATVVNNSRHIAIDTHLFTALVWRKIICQHFFVLPKSFYHILLKILKLSNVNMYSRSCH